jgi:D-glycero-D-manno-heptose 1,7-bisphosphate phosphatase
MTQSVNSARGLILLDRDGVLNRIVIDAEHGTIDSPLHPNQVEIYPWVPSSLLRLNQAGFRLAIVTNQPAAAKKKTTFENLDATHREVVRLAQAEGAVIESSHLCLHRSEDQCSCRKPKTGLLEQAIAQNSGFDRSQIWMVGDGVTDVQAGKALGLRTAFFGPKKCDACKIFEERSLEPDYWGPHLEGFTRFLLGG